MSWRRRSAGLRRTLVTTDIREADQPERGYERPFRWLKDYGIPKKYRRYYTTPDNVTHITPRDSKAQFSLTSQSDCRL